MDFLIGVLKVLLTWGLAVVAVWLGVTAVIALVTDQTGFAVLYGGGAVVLLAVVKVLRKMWD